jgi:hypothetical protein
MKTHQVIAVVLACGGIAIAADAWKDKPSSEWSDKDVSQLLTKSPWAKEVPGTFSGGPTAANNGGGGRGRGGGGGGMAGGGDLGGVGGGGGMGGGGGYGGGGGGMGGGGGGMGGGGGYGGGRGGRDMGAGGIGGGMQAPQFTVRWESAAPMLESPVEKTAGSHAGAVAQWAKDYYVITVAGGGRGGRRNEMGGAGGGTGDWRPDPARMKEMMDRMKEATSLTPKGKSPVSPERVEMVSTPEGRVTAFLFPRSADLSLDDKEVTFHTAMGPMEVKSTFKLKDMVYQGKLQL